MTAKPPTLAVSRKVCQANGRPECKYHRQHEEKIRSRTVLTPHSKISAREGLYKKIKYL